MPMWSCQTTPRRARRSGWTSDTQRSPFALARPSAGGLRRRPPMRAAAESPPIQERRRDVRVSPRDGVSEPDVDRMVADHCKCALSCARRGCPPQSFTTTRPRTTACVAVPCSRATARVLRPRTLVFCATYPWNKCPKARTVARIPTDPTKLPVIAASLRESLFRNYKADGSYVDGVGRPGDL